MRGGCSPLGWRSAGLSVRPEVPLGPSQLPPPPPSPHEPFPFVLFGCLILFSPHEANTQRQIYCTSLSLPSCWHLVITFSFITFPRRLLVRA